MMSQACRKKTLWVRMKIASFCDFSGYLHKYSMQYLLSVSACGEGDFGPIWLTLIHSLHLFALQSNICNDLLPCGP